MSDHPERLLIVDDDEMNRDMLSRRLLRRGYQTTTANDGAEACNLVASDPFDLVLLDVEMPVMSGLTVLSRIREQYSAVELPVILVTGRSDSKDVVQGLDLGANDYITKPVDLAVALARIRHQLTVKKLEQALQASEERYALAAAGSRDGIWDWDLKTDAMYLSDRWKTMLGHAEDEIGSTPAEWLDRIHPEDRSQVEADLEAHLDGPSAYFENEHRMLHRDGSYRWVLTRGLLVRDDDGKPHRMAGSQSDITPGKVTDALTGIPNRTLFMDRLTQSVERAKRGDGTLFGLLFVALDRFKLVIDSLGQAVADQLLIAFVRRLEGKLRSTDTLSRFTERHSFARHGGEEFTLLLDGLGHPRDAFRVADRVLETLKDAFHVCGHEVFLGAHVGVSFGTGSESPEDLLRDAATAGNHAKDLGGERIQVFDSEMRTAVVNRLRIETDLRHAVERREFENWYQPIVDLASGRIQGFESLLRWQHPSRGLVPPDDFIPVAEETGLIVPMGLRVLEEACSELAVWQQLPTTDKPLSVSINLSRQQLQPGIVEDVQKAIERADSYCADFDGHFDPSCLKLEVTESLVMSNPKETKKILEEFRSMGVRIGIDDFGTGHSSLTFLHGFPLDELKIDRSFISRIESDPERLEIVRTIILLAQNLGLGVTAEGVETDEQLRLLCELGCDLGQGYLFSRPVDRTRVTDLITGGIRWTSRESAA